MGFTIIEKIISQNSQADLVEIYPGNIVWVDLDLVTARDYAGPQVIHLFEENYPGSVPFDSNKIIFTPDCYPYGNDPEHAVDQDTLRIFAKKHNLRLMDLGSGIGSHILFRKRLTKPGKIVIGADSHYNLLGALGILGLGAGDIMLAFAMKTGKYWIKIPETVKVVLEGEYSYPTTAKDLALFVLKALHEAKVAGKAVEFYGEIISKLTIEERVTLCSLITEANGLIGIIPPDDTIREFYNAADISLPNIEADHDARYESVLRIDIQDLGCYIACPPYPHNVKPVEEVLGTPLDSIIIGSCTNGTASDIEYASKILENNQVHPDVRLSIIPATREDLIQLTDTNIFTSILHAGGNFFGTGCSTCAKGQFGLSGDAGTVTLTTGNRNTKGKTGPGKVFLASPVIAAASALEGKIAKPRR